ncbi:MAG: AraC family transcriptional regulator [Bacteroidales bacterium]|nr:AraC family transcriptional regulator [Bacteroidales bacterium]
MKLKCLLWLWFFFLPFCVFAQKRPAILEKHLEALKKEPDNEDALKFLCQYYLNKGDYSKTVTYAEFMRNVADKRNNPLLQLYSCLYQGQAQLMSGREKIAKKNLNQALELATKLNNDSALCAVYRSMGVYAANIDTDYYRALRWMYKGIQLAQQNNLQQPYALLLSNLAYIYYLKKDTSGIRYALECYELGHSMQDPFVIYSGAIQAAYMYFLAKENAEAMKYIREAEALMMENDFYDQAHTYNLFGNILYEMGEYAQSTEYFRKAMKDKQAAQTSSIVYAHLGYARVLIKQKKYEEAILMLKQGIAISYARANAIHRNELYENLSACYEQLHQYHEALNYYKVFSLENDSLFNKDKERDLSEMRFKYDSERQENLIKQGKLDVMEKEQRIQQQTFILIIIVVVLGLLYYLYVRKNKLYLSIVKQNQEAIKRETELNRRIKELEEKDASSPVAPEKYAASSLTDEKSMELFRTLERIMSEEKIYKDNSISKDKVAELLGTNRTYLSRIINEQAKLSFTHYVNRFRIDEAIRLLSDPENHTPLKALSADLGFNSISTFYNLFQTKVGMTPSQYRNKVMELQKQQ